MNGFSSNACGNLMISYGNTSTGGDMIFFYKWNL